MQTFLPYQSFGSSAWCLDDKRLNKQRVEAKQIYLSLTEPSYGWKHHPAVKQWAGYESALACYGLAMCYEWKVVRKKGDDADLLGWFERLVETPMTTFELPWWLGIQEFHASHRSNLLRKFPEWYSQFDWQEPFDLPYWWPSHHESEKELYA
jgi:hypothetical protein